MIFSIGAWLEIKSPSFSETSKTIANIMIIPNMKKNVERNFLMIYLSIIDNIRAADSFVSPSCSSKQ